MASRGRRKGSWCRRCCKKTVEPEKPELSREARRVVIVWSCWYWENWKKQLFKQAVGELGEEQLKEALKGLLETGKGSAGELRELVTVLKQPFCKLHWCLSDSELPKIIVMYHLWQISTQNMAFHSKEWHEV